MKRPIPRSLLIGAALVLLWFALFTGQVWEDFFITARYSINLVRGLGLVHQPGDRVQGFTSPLGVLLPALAYALTGTTSGMVWGFRLVSIAAFLVGLALLYRALSLINGGRLVPGMLTAVCLYLLEPKQVAFSVNGMETALVLLFLAGAVRVLADGSARHPVLLGVCGAGLLWARPDGIVFLAALGVGAALFSGRNPREDLQALGKAAAVAAALYLPWFFWSWAYYGSPVPHSVVAKGVSAYSAAYFAERLGRLPGHWLWLYLPPYAEFGSWRAFRLLALVPSLIGTLYWLYPRGRNMARAASLAAFGGLCYLAAIPQNYPWYYPPVVLLTLMPLAAFLDELGHAASRWARASALVLVPIVLLPQAALLVDYARLSRAVAGINEVNRQRIGEWLRDHARPGDRVFLENAGYIGFYSGLHILDYPGILSPEVVRIRRLQGDSIVRAGTALGAEWMVLRPSEIEEFEAAQPGWLASSYQVEKLFDVSEEFLKASPDHPADMYDTVFFVLRRRDGAPPGTAAEPSPQGEDVP